MKSQIISSMTSFVLGTGVTLASLYSWLGTADLQAIEKAVRDDLNHTNQLLTDMGTEYWTTVDEANASIGDYKQALEQANDNISQLITAYQQAEEQHQQELENANQQAEQDLADLQAELDNLYARMDSQYETDMNKVIEQANAQINQANTEVAETKENILAEYEHNGGAYMNGYDKDKLLGATNINQSEKLQEVTDEDLKVNDISSVVPSEQPQN